jgi:hypothetical protein
MGFPPCGGGGDRARSRSHRRRPPGEPSAATSGDITEAAGHERARRPQIELAGLADLLEMALAHDTHPVAHRHRLLLVMGHEDRGDPPSPGPRHQDLADPSSPPLSAVRLNRRLLQPRTHPTPTRPPKPNQLRTRLSRITTRVHPSGATPGGRTTFCAGLMCVPNNTLKAPRRRGWPRVMGAPDAPRRRLPGGRVRVRCRAHAP